MINKTLQLWDDKPDVKLETYLLAESEGFGKHPKPVVVVCPGGAYLGTSDREAEPVALRFNAMGYHAVVLRYSTFNYGEMKWFDESSSFEGCNPNASYPHPVVDLAKTLLTIRELAGEWQVDLGKIALCGFSAGAHLCASYGVHWHSTWLGDLLGCDLIRPAALILGYPLTDYILMKSYSGQSADEKVAGLWHVSNMAVFGKPEPTDEELSEASPINFISDKTPPTFLWHTATDGLVPAENSTRFASALVAARVPCELHLFEQGDHGLSLADESTAELPEQIVPRVQPWIRMCQEFLACHLS